MIRFSIGLLSLVAMAGGARALEGRVDRNFPARCWITQDTGGQLSVFLRACNNTGGDVFGITASPLSVVATGTAGVEFQTFPAERREADDGNCHTMKWQLLLQCGGTITLSGDATAENESNETINTGLEACGRLDVPCSTITPTRTPFTTPTLHAKTPLATATPRPNLATPTPKPRNPLNTPTPRPRLPTPTPRPQFRTPTFTPRLRLPTPTPKPPKLNLTPTPRPRRPTPTLHPPLQQPTLRPTRTPLPSRVPAPIILTQFTGRCTALNPDALTVTAFLQLFNNTGGDITNIVPCDLDIRTSGSAAVTSLRGPFPPAIGVLLDGHSTRFSWTLTTTGQGQIILHACATGQTPDGRTVVFDNGDTEIGPVQADTGLAECNALNVPARVTP